MKIYMIRKIGTGSLQYIYSWPYQWRRQSEANMWWGAEGLKTVRLILRDLKNKTECEIVEFEFKETS